MSKGSSSEKESSSDKKKGRKDAEDTEKGPEEGAVQEEDPRPEEPSEESSKGKGPAETGDEAPREQETPGEDAEASDSDKPKPKKRKRRKKAGAKKKDSKVEGEAKDKGGKRKKSSRKKKAKTSSKKQPLPSSPEEIVDTLKRLKEDIGQIKEMSFEEGNIVRAFALAFLELMEPLAKSLPVDVSILPLELGFIERANVLPTGELVLLHRDGRMESIDLTEPEKRDLLVNVVSDVMPKFKALISDRRLRIEKRITFLSSVTKELQNIADSFATVHK